MNSKSIAVIGIGCRFPQAEGPEEFWQLLKEGRDAISEVPTERWDIEQLYHPDPDEPGKMNTRWGGFIDDPFGFDNVLFSLSEQAAFETDPQQRLLLEVAWRAFEHGGFSKESVSGLPVGVFMGISNMDFARSNNDIADLGIYSGAGSAFSIAANRLSYFFDLHGPSIAVDTACSSSLVAVHLACQALINNECAMALAGGANLMLGPEPTIAFSKARMMSPDGRCKVFDASADGYVRGEGAGAVLLKPLADAERDGDPILAVIRGTGINQDGRTNGLTAPNPRAQSALIKHVCQQAGVNPSAIDYVELHGTGTALGDSMEARALSEALCADRTSEQSLRVGSVKSNMGHLESAAGIAGLIKLVLSLQKACFAPSLHFETPNPHIDQQKLQLKLQDQPMPWKGDSSRYGGVSSFGFGGTNAHVVLQAAPEVVSTNEYHSDKPVQLLTLSAHDPQALSDLAENYIKILADSPASSIAELCQSANLYRGNFRYRAAVVGEEAQSLINALSAIRDERENCLAYRAAKPVRRRSRPAFLFTGQGCHYLGMGRELYNVESLVAKLFDEIDGYLPESFSISLTDLLLKDELSELLQETRYVQPLLFALEVALARLWQSWGVEPSLLLGHSLGEYAAAHIAGAFSLKDALHMVVLRGEGMQRCTEGGAMASLLCSSDEAELLLSSWKDKLEIAAENGSESTVISGDSEAMRAFLTQLNEKGVTARILPVNGAFHSYMMDEWLLEFEQQISSVLFQPLTIPVISNLTGEVMPKGTILDASYWCQHARQRVRFKQGLHYLSESKVSHCIEMGPKPVLSGIALADPVGCTLQFLSSLEPGKSDNHCLAMSLGRAFSLGVEVDFSAYAGIPPRRSLVAHPFNRHRFQPKSRQYTSQTISIEEELVSVIPHEPAKPVRDLPSEIRTTLAKLLGVSVDELDLDAPFVELGADSLVLVQMIRYLEQQFSVKLPIKLFFTELRSLRLLEAHLTHLSQQAESKPAEGITVQSMTAPQTAERTEAARSAKSVLPSFGVFEDKARERSERQSRHLQALIARYNLATVNSKRYTAKHRPHLADSRVAAGFRLSTKEMLYPLVGQHSEGACFTDLDGRRYTDISMGFGVHLFGHEPAFIKRALLKGVEQGIQLGPQAKLAGEVAQLITQMSGTDRVMFCNSGTEAVMASLRLARTHRRRDRVALFSGSYHGHSDLTLAEAVPGSPGAPGVASVAGSSPGAASDLLVLEYDCEQSLALIRQHADELAAVLVEPIQSRNPGLQPRKFLQKLRELTAELGLVLIFDEMITGFRLHQGGAQAWFDIRADLVVYGKIIGGGLPIGAVAGCAQIMDAVDGGQWQYGDDSFPQADATFFAGTFNKNPLTMASSHAVLSEMKSRGPALQENLNQRTDRLVTRLNSYFEAESAPLRVESCGSLFRFSFQQNLDLFFYHLLEEGVYVWEGRNCFISDAHTDAQLDQVVAACQRGYEALREAGYLKNISPVTPDVQPQLPLLPAQRQLWALSQLPGQGVAYHIPLLLKLTGELHVDLFSKALNKVTVRHDALSMAIVGEGRYQQQQKDVTVNLQCCEQDDGELQQYISHFISTPFDLQQPPLLRASLIKSDEKTHHLLLVAHHIIADGISLQLLAEEIGEAYQQLLSGHALELAQPGYWRDFVAWQVGCIATPEWESHRGYWLDALSPTPNPIQLPMDYSRSKLQSFDGARCSKRIGGDAYRKLNTLCREHGCTPFMGLLAIFSLLMARLSGQQKFVIGVPYAGRGMEGGESVFGYCTHLLPVSFDLDWHQSDFIKALQHVRDSLIDAHSHELFTYAQMLESLKLPHEQGHSPLVNVTFNLDQVEDALEWGGLQAEIVTPPVSSAKFDLGWNIIEQRGCLLLEADYNSGCFSESTVQHWLELFSHLLSQVSCLPETHVGQLSLDNPEAQQRLWQRWSPDDQPFKNKALLYQRVLNNTQQYPQNLAIVDQYGQLSYEKLGQRCLAVATYLNRVGLKKGDCVGLLLPRGSDMVVGLLAVMSAGGVAVALEPSMPAARLDMLIEEAGVSLLLTHPDSDGSSLSYMGKTHDLTILYSDNVTSKYDVNELIQQCPDICGEDGAYLCFTSGTSGRPKAVLVPHRAITNYVNALLDELELDKAARFGMVSTFSADLANSVIYPSLCSAGSLHIAGAECSVDPNLLPAWCVEQSIDVLKIAPSHFESMLSGAYALRILPKKCLILGGEACSQYLLEQLRAFNESENCVLPRLLNHYGPTEATVGALVGDIDLNNANPLSSLALQRPLKNMRAYLLDKQRKPVPRGISAELYLSGPGVALGYLSRCKESDEFFLDDPFNGGKMYRTGDCARFLEDGGLLLQGRSDDQLNINGHRIEPQEIANLLEQQEGVLRAFISPYNKPNGRRGLLAYYTGDISEDILQKKILMLLPTYMMPSQFFCLEQFPLTSNGKIDRYQLPQPETSISSSHKQDEQVDASDEVTRLLQQIWGELLSRDKVSLRDNFFDLGGDSITVIQAASRLYKQGYRLATADLFRYPTIAGLVPHVVPLHINNAEQGLLTGDVALSPIQRWFFSHDPLPNPDQWNMSVTLSLAQGIECKDVQEAFSQLIEHHDGLRLSAYQNNGQWCLQYGEVYEPEVFDTHHCNPTTVQQSLSLDEGRLVALGWHSNEQGGELLIVIHHLAMDGISWRILLEDLATLLSFGIEDRTHLLGKKSHGMGEWLKRLASLAHSSEMDLDREYWAALATLPYEPLPQLAGGNNRVSDMLRVETILAKPLTNILLNQCTVVYNAEVLDLLLTALVKTFCHFTGDSCLMVDLEGHGREAIFDDVDVTRTIGWFTSRYPAWFELEDESFGLAIDSIKEQRHSIPRNGLGFGVLTIFGDDVLRTELEQTPQPELSFNYLGNFDVSNDESAPFIVTQQRHNNERDPDSGRCHLISIDAMVINDSLMVDWDYNPHYHSPDQIKDLAQQFMTTLEAIVLNSHEVDGISYTPSDFTQTDLKQSDLKDILKQIDA